MTDTKKFTCPKCKTKFTAEIEDALSFKSLDTKPLNTPDPRTKYKGVQCPSCNHNFCGLETEVYSRVVGYHRPVKNWNKGKQSEFKDRRLYSAAKAAAFLAKHPESKKP